jgi:hypothetical protein
LITNKKLFIASVLTSLLLPQVYADNLANSLSNINNVDKLYILGGVGASFSNDANISADSSFWDPSPQGYNTNLGTSEFYEGGLGYNISPVFSVQITDTYRPSYAYRKVQTPVGGNTPGFLGGKTRYFNLDDNALLATVVLHGAGLSDRLAWKVGQASMLQPFAGVGLGIAYNTVSNFHSEPMSPPADAPKRDIPSVAAMMMPYTSHALAYQGLLGLELTHKNMSIDFGYRYFNGGQFQSNTYITNPVAGYNYPTLAPAWKGTLTANEVFVDLRYAI